MCNSAYDKIHSIKYRTHMQNIILWYIRYAIRFASFIFAPFLFFAQFTWLNSHTIKTLVYLMKLS